ncbi:unnamed protein product [Mytilus coruscus]|uniref:Uncharacterized protein n=1 Tax=Mytilus coruscus TaxID=42192 RepID=A0A6J8DVR3_MYTCO|nr:unnamed protein product [Mytilus coruscus]
MYNLRNRQPSMSTRSMSLGRGRGSGINPPSSLAIPNHDTSSGSIEAHFSGDPKNSHDYFNASQEIEDNSNPFLVPTQSRSDSTLISRSTISDSDELTQLRRKLDALKNENLELKRTAKQYSLSIPNSSQTNPNQNLVNTITQSTEQLGPIVYAGTHSYVNQDIASSKISQKPVIYNNMNRVKTQTVIYYNIQFKTEIPNSINQITEPNVLAIQHSSGPQFISTSEVTRINENGRRTRVPFYNGKDPWNAYVMQFELIAEMNNSSPSTKAIELVTALKDEAMVHVSFLTPEKKRTYSVLCAALSTDLETMGLPALLIHQVTLYETYKRGSRDRNIRQLGTTDCSDTDDCESEDIEVRKVGGKRSVTEERLTQFERGMSESLAKIIQRERASTTKHRSLTVVQGQIRCIVTKRPDLRTQDVLVVMNNYYIKDCTKGKRNQYHKDNNNRNGLKINYELNQNQN